MTLILLDTAICPAPQSLTDAVASVKGALGADVALAYYLGGSYSGGSGWTSAIVSAYASYGFQGVLPVWVSPDPTRVAGWTASNQAGVNTILAAARADAAAAHAALSGYPAAPQIALDVEADVVTLNPNVVAWYVLGWMGAYVNNRLIYSSQSTLDILLPILDTVGGGAYAALVWTAAWQTVSLVLPTGALPAPSSSALNAAWQYAHDVNIAGGTYDLSRVFDSAIIGGSMATAPVTTPTTWQVYASEYSWRSVIKDAPMGTNGVWLAWQADYINFKFHGPLLTPPYLSTNWSGNPIEVYECAGARGEWDITHGGVTWYSFGA